MSGVEWFVKMAANEVKHKTDLTDNDKYDATLVLLQHMEFPKLVGAIAGGDYDTAQNMFAATIRIAFLAGMRSVKKVEFVVPDKDEGENK